MRPPLVIIGLTGSIGMGKTTTAAAFKRLGIPVHDADAAVHKLFARGGAAVQPIEEAFPGVVADGAVDRARLSQKVLGDDAALRRLEAIVHPLVGREKTKFLIRAALTRRKVVVLDIPLLFETGGQKSCDLVVVASAPEFLQTARVIGRPGMTSEKLAAIRANQMPDRLKRRLADFVVPTGLGRAFSLKRVRQIATIAKDMERPKHHARRIRRKIR